MSDSVYSGVVSAFFTICFIAWLADWPPVASQEVTAYREVCLLGDKCRMKELGVYKQVYRADPATHTVTSWFGDGYEVAIADQCAIRNKENWVCENTHVSTLFPLNSVSMHEGQVAGSPSIPWYRYWWIRFLHIGNQ